MPRPDPDRFGEISVFLRIAELGSLSAAARACRLTPSAVSKLLTRLELRLGARLVHRSTRRLQLTAEGSDFYERSVRLLADLDEAERSVGSAARPSGLLRVNVNVPFATKRLLPLVPDFLELYPEVTLDLVITDTVVDLMEARTDVAIRAGPLKSSSLIARKLGETGKMVVASPAYLARRGIPATPADLAGHNRIRFGYARAIEAWPFVVDGAALAIPPEGDTLVSDGESLRQLAVAGLGLARLSVFHIGEDLTSGRLVPVLEAFNPGDREAFFALFVGPGARVPSRVRAFLDFLSGRHGLG